MVKWPLVPFGEILKRQKDEIDIQENVEYARLTIRINGRGVDLRDRVLGSAIGTKRQFVARVGQLVLSKIDARNGAFGILPSHCDQAIITGNFWAFEINDSLLDSKFFEYFTMTSDFLDFCIRASEGTTNRRYLQEPEFLKLCIRLPPLDEQRCLVKRIEALMSRLKSVDFLQHQMDQEINRLLLSVYHNAIQEVPWLPMSDVAPLVRRPVEIDPLEDYPELGIRSFGKGSFHKPPLQGSSVGSKKLFRIEEGDLVFNIVFAWEGAVAVARGGDTGRFGSHRFLTCVANRQIAIPEFLLFYFLTERGLEELGKASPGGAGRNRTLGIESLARIVAPVPDIGVQRQFVRLLRRFEERQELRESIGAEAIALRISVLNRTFAGSL
jgi:type I restriction enzyme S subunit